MKRLYKKFKNWNDSKKDMTKVVEKMLEGTVQCPGCGHFVDTPYCPICGANIGEWRKQIERQEVE